MILDTTTRSLEVDLTGSVATSQLPFVASYVDINQSTFAMSAASTNTGATNNTTAVTLVAVPGATTSRQLKYLSIKNSDTAAVELWVQVNDNGTLREIWKGTLAVGDTLVYIDSAGYSVINSSGQIKSGATGTFTSTRVPFADSGGNLTTDAGFTFNTTGDILTVGAINVTGTTAPTTGWYSPSAGLIRTPNNVIADGTITSTLFAINTSVTNGYSGYSDLSGTIYYRNASDVGPNLVQFFAGGSKRGEFSATGLNIVGTLTVSGTSLLTGAVTSSNIAALTTIAESWIGPSSTTGIYFKGGNVGIGNTDPAALLDVSGIIRIRSVIDPHILFNNTAFQSSVLELGSGTTPALSLYFDKVTILNGGNVGIGTPNPPEKLSQGTTNNAIWGHGQASELLTLSTVATFTDTTANLLPQNSIIESVVARITTTITTATDWKLGDAATTGRFTAANATMTAGTTDIGLVHVDVTGAGGPRQTAAAKVRVTTTGTPGAGAIRITVFYRTMVAPTS